MSAVLRTDRKEHDGMKAVAFNGSARKDGNTAVLIKTVFEELEKEFASLGKKN